MMTSSTDRKTDPGGERVVASRSLGPRIAHVTTVDTSLRYLLLDQLQALQKEGYEVVGISAPGENVAFLEDAGVPHLAVPMQRVMSPLADLAALRRLVNLMRAQRFALVHTHTPKPGLIGQLAARLAGVPIIVNTIHGYYFHENMSRSGQLFYKTLERIAARMSTLVFFVNQEDMATAVRENICTPDKVALLGPGGIGVDINRFDRRRLSSDTIAAERAKLGLDPQTKVVGFVGRLVAEKGINELLQAVKPIAAAVPGVKFLFVGGTDVVKSDALTPAVADAYGVADKCIFTGTRQDIPELMVLMDVFVLPTHREGFSVVLMEASAMGVPVVATAVRGCREAVEHGRNGLLVPLGDVDALAEAVIEILNNEDQAQEMARQGRLVAEERFDQQIVFQRVSEAYARLLREHGIALPAPPATRSE